MIGVQAISGGLLGLTLLAALALTGAGAVVGGSVLAFRRRWASGALCASLGAALLVGIGIVVAPMFASSIERHVVDLKPAPRMKLRDAPARCAPVGSEEWCFVSEKIRNLVVILPDGERRSFFGASSLHADFSGSELKRLAFMVAPPPNGAQLSSLLASEAKTAGGAVGSEGAEEVLRRVGSNEVVKRDQYLLFAHPGYTVRVWILPRYSAQEAYGVWYEVLGEAPGGAISSSTRVDRSNWSFDAAAQVLSCASRPRLPVAGQLRR